MNLQDANGSGDTVSDNLGFNFTELPLEDAAKGRWKNEVTDWLQEAREIRDEPDPDKAEERAY